MGWLEKAGQDGDLQAQGHMLYIPSPIIKAAMLTLEPAREEAEPQASPASLERSLHWASYCHTRAGLPGAEPCSAGR